MRSLSVVSRFARGYWRALWISLVAFCWGVAEHRSDYTRNFDEHGLFAQEAYERGRHLARRFLSRSES